MKIIEEGGKNMNCDRAEKLLPLYLDGELSALDETQVEAHLQACSACRNLLSAYENDQRMLAALSPVVLPSGWHGDLMAKVRLEEAVQAPKLRKPGVLRYLMPRLASLAAALFVIILTGNFLIFPASYDAKVAPSASPEQSGQPALMRQYEGDPADDMVSGETYAAGGHPDDETAPAAAVPPVVVVNQRQRVWVFSSALGLFIWGAGAAFFYRRHQKLE